MTSHRQAVMCFLVIIALAADLSKQVVTSHPKSNPFKLADECARPWVPSLSSRFMYVDLPIVLQARIQASSCAVGQRACCEAEEAATSMPFTALSRIAAWKQLPRLLVQTSAYSAGGTIQILVIPL